jgi:hypothetical protein
MGTIQQRRPNAAGHLSLAVGEPFNSFKLFTGIFVPEGLARDTSIGPGAKLAWARMARYAGQNGTCFPSMKTLGQEIGVGERQAQKYVFT